MNIERLALAIAGAIILISIVLVYFVSTWYLILIAFVGFNLLQSAFTGFCPLAIVIRKFNFKSGIVFK